MKKLNYIFCKNFKAFYGNDANESTNKIVLDGKNLLLYGENGSGKSSLYWALYTFLQSALKNDDAEVTKYFDPNDDDNLRNRYCQDTDDSAIELSFEGDDSNPERIIEISENYSKSTDSTFLYDTLLNSDFLNYKFLFKLYDFSAKERIDLFPLFQKEMFPFIKLEKGNADLLWKQLMASIDPLDRFVEDKNGEKSFEVVKENVFSHIQQETLSFSFDLQKKLNDIKIKANEYLKKMEYNNLVIVFDFQYAQCDKDEDDKNVARFYPPQVFLEVEDESFATKQQIGKPHIFLNEAKLSAVALSIRLALLDTRGSDDKAGRILVVDDLMISLDMSNRDKVLDILLEKASDYQIIMMTHDRALYELTLRRIKNRGLADDWYFKEMYYNADSAITKPFVINAPSFMDNAYKYLCSFDYPASANYMRKELERILTDFLPQDYAYNNDKGYTDVNKLEVLITKFKELCANLSIDLGDYERLFEAKDTIFNPLSHNDSSASIYRYELVMCYNKLKQLDQEFQKKIFNDNKKQISLNMNVEDNLENHFVYKLETTDSFYILKVKGKNVYYSNPICHCMFEKNGKWEYMIEKDQSRSTLKVRKLINDINNLIHKKAPLINITVEEIVSLINDDGSETLLKDL